MESLTVKSWVYPSPSTIAPVPTPAMVTIIPSVNTIGWSTITVPSHLTSNDPPPEQFKAVASSLASAVVVTSKDWAVVGQGSMLTAPLMAPSKNTVNSP